MANPYKKIEDENEEEDGEEGTPKKKGKRITDLKVSEISVVDKAANGERFLLYKSADSAMSKKGMPEFIKDKIEAKEDDEEDDPEVCEECGEDMKDCECTEKCTTCKKEETNLDNFVSKHGLEKSENLETEEFDEAGILGLLNKHV